MAAADAVYGPDYTRSQLEALAPDWSVAEVDDDGDETVVRFAHDQTDATCLLAEHNRRVDLACSVELRFPSGDSTNGTGYDRPATAVRHAEIAMVAYTAGVKEDA